MKTDVEQLSTYKSVHLNSNNVKTHFIGVPMIVWALMVLLSLVQLPVSIPNLDTPLNLAVVAFTGVLIYYFMLNISLAIGQIVFIVPALYSAHLVSLTTDALWIALGVFVIGWIIQFIGHHFEKAKPAFVDDLNQLLIGPFFIMAETFFMFGALKKLDDEITPLAIEKRRAFEAKK
ncbi:MAG: hypothetical protein COB38_05220 [Gammaproteobacteria bacterium]|nr:MAG: hypothetical protein COB38_05220 [Gammaproteobacteria bacterium]